DEEASRSAEPPVFRTIDGQPDVFFAEGEAAEETNFEPVAAPAPQPAASYPRVAHPGNGADTMSLLSASTSASVDNAFHSLAQAVMVQNGRTLEDIVCDMMRPMLKSWLDDNLPGLVERLVRAEIERVSRGRP
ncbi:MAG: PopZ family protein, partial [Pseudorhodoplanes sp.]